MIFRSRCCCCGWCTGTTRSVWDGWMTKERERGRGRRTSGVDWRGMRDTSNAPCPTTENGTTRHGIQEENPTHQIPYSVSSVIIHHQEWKVIYVRSLLLESGQIKCRGPFYVYWKPLYSRSSSSHWNKKQNLFNVRCIVH